jgi:hypothetical protein
MSRVESRSGSEPPIAEVFSLFADWAVKGGHTSLSERPGLFSATFGDFTVKLNPHSEETENVPPYTLAIEYLGWPAGLIDPYGGVLAAGKEDDLCAAITTAIEAIP